MSKKIGPRITISLPPEQVAFLNAESERTGAPISELIRRAVKLLAFGEAQVARTTPRPAVLVSH
jgi:Arc/MetJ-type ribon-helix-helix transcriptional regulator